VQKKGKKEEFFLFPEISGMPQLSWKGVNWPGRFWGDHVLDSLMVNQKAEWEEFYLEVRGKDRKHHLVTEYEIERLLPAL